jgi:hypothetical protein
VTASIKRAEKPSWLWILFDQDTLEHGPFLWFGDSPGEKLHDLGGLIAKHTKANSCGEKTEKAGHRALLRKRFTFMVLTVTLPRTPRDSIRSSSADIGQRVFGDSHELLCSCDSAFHQCMCGGSPQLI